MKIRILFFSLFLLLIVQSSFGQNSISLSGKWKVVWSGGQVFSKEASTFIHSDPLIDSARYVAVDVPMDLNLAMQKRGMLNDINFGTNTFPAYWVAEQYWKYYRHIIAPKEALNKTVWLVFDQLDYNATILLNGEVVGTHKNVYTPCRINVTGKLKEGSNLLTVAVESGLYDVADKEGSVYTNEMTSLVSKRQWLRKPQYQFGWDSSPKLINVGITGDVRLEWNEVARLDQIVTYTKMSDDLSSAELTIRPFIEGLTDNANLTVEATLLETNQKIMVQEPMTKTLRPFELKLKVEHPKLWWPAGYGAQNQYTIKVEIKNNGKLIDSGTRRFGFRKMEVDKSAHPVAGNYFTVKINNQKIFVKGADWVPSDLIFSSVTRERLEKSIDMAVSANFNFFRIWGGGHYVGNDFLDLCDEKGIMVWHDFPFACVEYPADNVDFYYSVKAEVTWAVREFAHHPSLIIWCGNNENELFTEGFTYQGKVVPDYVFYHYLFPNIIKAENPEMFYWPSSPFSENNETPNSPFTGDQHPWSVSLNFMGSDGPNFYGYRQNVDRFPTEGGFLGASSPATLRQFLLKDEQYVRSTSWDHHDNTFWNEQNITYWFDKSYAQMSFDNYVFASSLLQAEALSEYISNYHRRMFSSSSAIFWMYKDGWPASRSWTIVDYYNRKKLAYHTVRRAFAQVNVVIAEDGNKINVYGINDGLSEWKGKLQYGIFKNKGGYLINDNKEVSLPANASTVIASFDKSVYEKAGYTTNGAFAVLRNLDNLPVSQYKMLMAKFKDIVFEKPQISIEQKNGYAILTSPVFVWGVCLDINGESSIKDNCFDLLPGIPYYVKLNKGEKVSVKQTGSDLILGLKTK
ncbi:MAG: glycoside hydrolase family 2 protein [Paludibacteraceae bacterium]